jgi:VWFA-related protein
MLRRMWIPPLVLALTIAPLYSQTSPGPDTALKVETRLVLVDVVVTDDKGNPVPDLNPSDFAVYEDGVPQSIDSFDEHKGVDSAPRKSPALPPDVFTNYQAVQLPDSVNVLLLDWLNTQPSDQAFVRNEITQYVKSLAPGARLAIFTLDSGLRMVQGFTSDISALQATLTDKKDGAKPQISPLLPTQQSDLADQRVIEEMQRARAGAEEVEAVRDEMAAYSGSSTGSRIMATLQAFQQLARYLSTIPGRKNVIWFAGSFPISFFPQRGSSYVVPHEYAGELKQTADLLTPGEISVYPVSAQGLRGDDYSAAGTSGGNLRSIGLNRAGDQIAMETLAKDTGGQAFYNTNDLATAITRAVNDGSRYYTLTYAPSDETLDGKFRAIEIRLTHENYKLSYRRGYYADAPAPQDVSSTGPFNDHLIPFVTFGLPNFDQIILNVRVRPSVPQPSLQPPGAGENTGLAGPITRYTVNIAIPLDGLKLTTAPDGVRHGAIEEMLVAFGSDGTPLNLVAKNLPFSIKPGNYAYYQNLGIRFHDQIDVPNGGTYLRTAIYDDNSGDIGTLQVPLSVAPPH